MPITKYKAAAVTSEPRWFDLEAGVQKTINFINEAGQAGCKLVAFPEVWIPGYPYWMWKVTYLQSLPMLKRYRENSLRVDSEEMRRIRRAARANQVFVSMGFSELDHATLYLAQALGIPVHIMFTMPWSSTTAFPHPLVNLKNVDVKPGVANYVSYSVVEWMTWQG
ncbi:hypothetical protein BN1723_017273, partial [Verticillium longisporum]